MAVATVALIGAGPRTVGLLERLAANADSGGRLVIHVVDQFPPGAGRTWRRDQPPLLRMNSRVGEVTMFTDASVTCEGPIQRGPTLYEWARTVGGQNADPDLAAESRRLAPGDFASRRLAGEYLRWCFWRAVADLPQGKTVMVHEAVALSVTDRGDRQRVLLSNGRCLDVDVLVLAQGNIDGPPDGPVGRDGYAEFARSIGGSYVPPHFPAEVDTTVLPAGTDVIVSGLGLSFFDLMALVTTGRGGRFMGTGGGRLCYRPSGAEPVLWVGSRRGLPYRPKPMVRVDIPTPPLVFATAGAVESVARSGRDRVESAAEVWGLVCQELGWAYYRELFHRHRDRTRVPWPTFAATYRGISWWDDRMADLVRTAVPASEDQMALDLKAFSLHGRTFASAESLATWLCADLDRSVHRATHHRYSAEVAAFGALVAVATMLQEVALPPEAATVLAPLRPALTFLGNGPPAFRLAQLAALCRAGLVRFLGAGLEVTADAGAGAFTARTTSLGDTVTHARHFVEARLPDGDVVTGDPLLSRLVGEARGLPVGPAGSTRLLVEPETYRIRTPLRIEPARLAMGGFASGGAIGSLSRPGTNAAFFRQNDMAARRILRWLGALSAQPQR